MHHRGFRAIMKQVFKALHMRKGEWKGKGKGEFAGRAGKGGKGKGECGAGASKGEWLQRKGDWLQCKGELLKSKGEWCKAKAMGKGRCGRSPEEWAEHLRGGSPSCGLDGLLGGLLGQKGFGKGVGFWPGLPSRTVPEGGHASAPAAVDGPPR